MVSLTMRVGETWVIGQKLAFTVLGVAGNQVKVDIAAEAGTSIDRRSRPGHANGAELSIDSVESRPKPER